MWKRSESTEVLEGIWKIVRTSGKILATRLLGPIYAQNMSGIDFSTCATKLNVDIGRYLWEVALKLFTTLNRNLL